MAWNRPISGFKVSTAFLFDLLTSRNRGTSSNQATIFSNQTILDRFFTYPRFLSSLKIKARPQIEGRSNLRIFQSGDDFQIARIEQQVSKADGISMPV